MRSANIEYARIDGKTPLSQRQKTLDNFDRTRNISVLIMTTGTGALGYVLEVTFTSSTVDERLITHLA